MYIRHRHCRHREEKMSNEKRGRVKTDGRMGGCCCRKKGVRYEPFFFFFSFTLYLAV